MTKDVGAAKLPFGFAYADMANHRNPTIRQFYKAAAITGLLASPIRVGVTISDGEQEAYVDIASSYADKMIAEDEAHNQATARSAEAEPQPKSAGEEGR